MNSLSNEDLILKTLQATFRQAVYLKTLEKSKGGDSGNVTSEIINLTVEYEEDNEFHLRYLTLKIPAAERPQHSLCVKLNVFRREAYMYEKLLPYINELFDSDISPKHFHTTDSNILVLENLAAQGYTTAPGNKFLNEVQFAPVLETLAKLHAASFKVLRKHPYLLADNIFEDHRLLSELQPFSDEWIPVICKTLERSEASHLIPKVKVVLSTMTHENGIKQKILAENFNFVVLNHGDFRRENLLIKYGDDNEQQVVDVKIIDFQYCMWSSPVQDFLYCMIMSVQIDLIEEHFDNFVNLYVNYLQETLLRLGCTETYDTSDFMVDFEGVKISMNIALISLCCVLLSSIERKNQDLYGNVSKNIPHGECLDDEDFVRIISNVIKYFAKVGALDASYTEAEEL